MPRILDTGGGAHISFAGILSLLSPFFVGVAVIALGKLLVEDRVGQGDGREQREDVEEGHVPTLGKNEDRCCQPEGKLDKIGDDDLAPLPVPLHCGRGRNIYDFSNIRKSVLMSLHNIVKPVDEIVCVGCMSYGKKNPRHIAFSVHRVMPYCQNLS